jgi:septum site-determining protein MinC
LQQTDHVIIKGTREGLLFLLDDEVPFSEILRELLGRITGPAQGAPGFFAGAVVTVNAGRRVIDNPDFEVLYRMLTRNGMRLQSFVSQSAQSRMVSEAFGVSSRPPSFAAGEAGASLGLKGRGYPQVAPPTDVTQEAQESRKSKVESPQSEIGRARTLDSGPWLRPSSSVDSQGTGLFLRGNLRPGQSVRYAGDVCLLGDVEQGADIIADGDVVVWGALNGVVHAGAAGNVEAVVCALQLSPAQLAIAGIVSRFPNRSPGEPGSVHPPELARLEDGRIVVEAWQNESIV